MDSGMGDFIAHLQRVHVYSKWVRLGHVWRWLQKIFKKFKLKG